MKQFLLIFCMLLSGIAIAQEDDNTKKYQVLYENARTAYQNQEYLKCIEAYSEMLSYPESDERRENYLYNISCCYSLLHRGKEALDYLDKAIDAGYADDLWIQKDSDFDFVKQEFSKDFAELVEKAKVAAKTQPLTKSPIAVVEYDNYTGPTDISKYLWDDFHHPKMDSLRNKYSLYSIIEDGKTEFEKLKRLLDWVSNRWEHVGDNATKEWNALAILDAVAKGERFRCVEYSIVFANCAAAIGYPARIIGLSRLGVAYGSGKGHVCTEVWSNQYQKWLLFDPQNNAWWEAEGVPLNAQECRRMFINDREEDMQFIGQNDEYDYNQLKSSWIIYFYHLVYPYNNHFFEKAPEGSLKDCEFISDGVVPELYFQKNPQNRLITSDEREAYPQLNKTKISLRHTNMSPTETLKVILTHTMPFFDMFMVRINGENWKKSEAEFLWPLAEDENTIEVQAVNLAGFAGQVSRIVLKNNIKISAE